MRTLRRYWWVAGIGIAAVVVIVLAPLASTDPDGLTAVAGQHGFLASAQDAIYSIIPGYSVPGIDDPVISKVVGGLIGVAIIAGLLFVFGRILSRRKA